MLRLAVICLLLVGVVGLGGVAWVALKPPPVEQVAVEAPVEAPRAAFLVAVRPLRAGRLITAEDLGTTEMEIAAAPPGARRASREMTAELVGAMVRRSLPQGEVIRNEDLMRPGERGFLAAILGPDMRAFSVSVDAVTGTAGLIWPGDRVDLLLTQTLNDETLPAFRRVLAETVLSDVRVIAIDQALVQGAVTDAPDANRPSRTVTLEVTPRQGEIAAVATRLGRLSLIVRSAADQMAGTDHGPQEGGTAPRAGDPAAPLWAGDVSTGLRHGRPSSAPPQVMQIFLGGSRREEYRF
jgi:pilus assembly protein CpaB